MQIAVLLFYFRAVMSVLLGGFLSPLGLLLTAASIGSGFGIANEKRWGYVLGLVTAGIGVIFVLGGGNLISLLFAIALVALLLHPQSRDYQRIWFN